MAVVDGDIKLFCSTTMPDSDSPTQIGGAIDTTCRVSLDDIAPDGTVRAKSDNGADTMNMTIDYIKDDGTVTFETKALTGTTPIVFADTMKTILKVTIASAAAGIVTVEEVTSSDTILTLLAGETEIRRVFYNAVAEASGGSERKYYDKFFIKNTNGASNLTSAQVIEQADPLGVIAFALEATLDGTTDNGVGNNRRVAPSGFTFDSVTKNVANSQVLTFGTAQGIWVELTLAAGLASAESTVTIRLSGVAA